MPLDPDVFIENELKELEKEGEKILKEVKLRSFTATPERVDPFGEAVLNWDVAGPSGQFSVRIGNFIGPANGNLTVSPQRQTTYQLDAIALGASKRLGVRAVDVDLSACCRRVISENDVERVVRQFLNTLLSGSNQVTLRNSATDISVNISARGMDVEIPLRLEINNFYDADVDIVLKFSLGVRNSLAPQVTLRDADVDVKFGLAEHIGSLGSASLVQGVAQVTIEALLQSVLRRCVEEELEKQITQAAERLCPGSASGDGSFGFHALSTTNEGVSFTYCPLPSRPLIFSTVLTDAGISVVTFDRG